MSMMRGGARATRFRNRLKLFALDATFVTRKRKHAFPRLTRKDNR